MQRSAHADPSHEHLICVCHRPSIHHPHRHHLHPFPPSRRLACSSHRSLDPNSIALRCHQDLSPGQHRRPSIRSTNDVALDVLACLGEFSFTPFVRSLSSHFPSSVFGLVASVLDSVSQYHFPALSPLSARTLRSRPLFADSHSTASRSRSVLPSQRVNLRPPAHLRLAPSRLSKSTSAIKTLIPSLSWTTTLLNSLARQLVPSC